jgi:hypothetical protein
MRPLSRNGHEIIGQLAQDFCSYSRRINRGIASYVTVLYNAENGQQRQVNCPSYKMNVPQVVNYYFCWLKISTTYYTCLSATLNILDDSTAFK